MALRINGEEVLASGSVVIVPGCEASIDVLPGQNIRFKFSKSATGTTEVKGTLAGDALTFEFFNVENSLGISYSNTIGKYDGFKLEMAVFIHAAGAGADTCRLLNYTFWKGARHEKV